MATSPNPALSSVLAQQLVQRLAQKRMGAGAQGPGGDNAAGPEAAGDQLSQQLAELRGADPNMVLNTLQQMKGMIVALFNRTAFAIPEASRALSQSLKYIDAAIKAAQQAAATSSAVRPSPSPINNSAGLPASGDSISAGTGMQGAGGM